MRLSRRHRRNSRKYGQKVPENAATDGTMHKSMPAGAPGPVAPCNVQVNSRGSSSLDLLAHKEHS